MRPSLFRIALVFSVVIHALIGFWLFHKSGLQERSKKGVVSIELIQPVQHSRQAQAARRPRMQPVTSKKVQSEEQGKVAEPQSEIVPSMAQSGETGDPQGVARESDLYIAQVTQLINRHKIYPKEAIDREEEGKVVVAVTLSRDGSVLDSIIEERCPFEILNGAALRTLRSINRFPTIPLLIPAPMHLHIPLIYKIER